LRRQQCDSGELVEFIDRFVGKMSAAGVLAEGESNTKKEQR
jgi:hypothetical protein